MRSALESLDDCRGLRKGDAGRGGRVAERVNRGEIKPRAQPANAAARADAEISLRPLVVVHVVHVIVHHLVVYVLIIAVPHLARRTTVAKRSARERERERKERANRTRIIALADTHVRACVLAVVRARGGACGFSRVDIPGVEEKKPRRPLVRCVTRRVTLSIGDALVSSLAIYMYLYI